MMCCPLQGADEYATAGETTIRTARKEHRCEECREPIRPRDRYEHASTLYDGSWSTTKTCLLCVEIRSHFACSSGWIYGELWSDLRDNFFPDMSCGGPCMAGLSPAAKAKLIAARMKWYLDQDEIDDSRWEGDGWRPAAARAPRSAPPFVPPAYALLEHDECSEWMCRVGELLGYLRRGGLDQRGNVVHTHVAVLEERIRDAERACRGRSYSGRHAESIVPEIGRRDWE